MSKYLNLASALLAISTAATAQDAAPSRDGGFGLGRAALPDEVAAWNHDIRPDGQGLPEGSGDVLTGEDIYINNCSVCHGDFGEAVGRWPVLAGGEGTMQNADPVKTVGSFWPYLSTVYDYVGRAMPFGHAESLTADETYALTAYILYLNDLVDEEFTLTQANFTEVEMPNVGNFIDDDRIETEFPVFMTEACMENCKDSVEITMHASVVDVTPEETAADAAEAAAATGDATEPAATTDMASAEPAEAPPAQAEAPAEPATEAVVEEPTATAALDPALVADGERAFRQCSACHMVGENAQNRVGPQLNAVVGRTIGEIEDFRYSDVFQDAMDAGEMWNTENLHAFLANPRDAMPGTKMSFRGVRDEADIDALIAYLQSLN